jgi:hypothetical protein
VSNSGEDSIARISRVFTIFSLTLGLLALLGRLAYEAACADLGADLRIDSPAFRVSFNLGSLCLAILGLLGAVVASMTASSWRKRVGALLPGLLANGMAILWFAFFR